MTTTPVSSPAAAGPAIDAPFQDLHDLIEEFASVDSIATEDVLAAVLPLMRQTAELHERSRVAPLDGIEALRAHGGVLFFGPGAARSPNWNSVGVTQMQRMGGPLDLAAACFRAPGGMGGAWAPPTGPAGAEAEAAPVLSRGAPLTAPAYLPDYRVWEHAIGHHDAVTDIAALGMIAISLALGLDFTEERQLAQFAAHRDRLTQLNPRLHPTAAEILSKMTALDRRERPQDLADAIRSLERHRQLAPAAAREAPPPSAGRAERILTELRGRLYDLSRRNKLLHHKPSSAELNLTEASCPITLRAAAVRAEHLIGWRGDFADRVTAGETVALSEFIRFEERSDAPATLDRIRAQARRDKNEFGFSQLRLVAAFLRWRNLKEDPETPISSPLLLLPVELKKRRGVHDDFDLAAPSPIAEVNPALRRLLRLLYDIDLPATVDLSDDGAAAALHAVLAEQIGRSSLGVKLTLREAMDRDSLIQMHAQARRRLETHKRRTRPAAVGEKRHGPLSYSYARTNWRPLGEQLYHRYVAPAAAPRRGGARAQEPRRRLDQMALPLDMEGRGLTPAAAKPEDATPDPRAWIIDLCAVTLANFNYRKMSLVRDFDALLDGALAEDRGAFAHVFSEDPRPLPSKPARPPQIDSRQVVPADPTQEAAVVKSRDGGSYVIQGPPGAGKSQTIANLIADFLGRGKRVLFVCEKRAALDVVYHRLAALGLHHLCALVHDSQEDKKAFVLDLKRLSESWLERAPDDTLDARRAEAAERIERGLARLADLDADMTSDAEGAPIHELISHACGGGDGCAGAAPLASDHLPSLKEWRAGREAAGAMADALERLGCDPVLARHPARFIAAEVLSDPARFERMTEALDVLGAYLETMLGATKLGVWPKEKPAAAAPGAFDDDRATRDQERFGDAVRAPLAALFAQIDLACRLLPLAASHKLSFLVPGSSLAEYFRNELDWLASERQALAEAMERTQIWREKLSPVETEAALSLAERHEGKTLGFLSAPWKKARREVEERVGYQDLAIKPKLRALLADLTAEHKAAAKVEHRLRVLGGHVGLSDGEAAIALAEERDARTPREGPGARPLFELILQMGDDAADRVRGLAALKPAADAARAAFEACFEGLDTLPAEAAFGALSELEASRDALPAVAPALRALAGAPESVRAALRRIDAPVAAIERAVSGRAVERAMAARPALREADGAAVDAVAAEIGAAMAELRGVNAAHLIETARRRFVDHVHMTTRLDLELDPETQKTRRRFEKARQELDRELSKSTRFKSVRELMSGDAGLLIRDLKPIWLMSPLSVADAVPLEQGLFDVAIFDEASQVPIEEAAPTLVRAPQTIVVGDEKQLPPTNFFGAPAGGDEDEADEDDAPAIDLDGDSFLAQAAKTLPSTLLGWHYRSRSEQLIAFSNAVFYGGRLISVPSTRRPAPAEPIEAAAPEDGALRWRDTLERAVSFHHTPFAVYDRQRNQGEAAYVAEMVRGILGAKTGRSIGVVAFSEAQQSAIERALDQLAREDAKFRDLYEAELDREEDGQYAGLFVKNLENVQGDERDIIIVSVCYAPDRAGRMRMNFGPINRAGGEKRLNVIFSRAKAHMAIISTIRGDAITNDYNVGAYCLKTYLRYAEAASRGDDAGARRALASVAPHAAAARAVEPSPIAQEIADRLRARGVAADANLGESAFVCDVAVGPAEGGAYRLAVLIDGPAHYANRDLLERHVIKQGVLSAFGWRSLSVLSLDWRRDPDRVLARIEEALGTE